jgi:hypothetical protein
VLSAALPRNSVSWPACRFVETTVKVPGKMVKVPENQV